jgi:CHAD domain-containing protein
VPLTLEAALPPAAAEGLLRTGPLAARRAGRARSSPVELTWLDTAKGSFATEGLALEQPRRGARRLLRIRPEPGSFWRPAAPPAALDGTDEPTQPEDAEEAALLPIGSFVGRATRLALTEGVEALLLRGQLRAMAAEAPVARLTLTGPAPSVLTAMGDLAAELPLLPPRAALAEEARALARGTPPVARRLGPPRLDPSLDVEGALMLALGHLTEVLLWHAPAAAGGKTPEGVHQMRVAMRRMRSLLRVFRPACDGAALRGFDARLKELAALLGPARDWDVFLEGLGAEVAAALPEEPRIAALQRAATARQQAAYAALRPAIQGPALRRIAWEAVALIETRPWRAETTETAAERRGQPLEDFAAGVLHKRWRRITEGGESIAALPDVAFHALRIEAKRLRYAAELFAPLWGRKKARRFLDRLAAVQEAFGLANDAVVARALMASLTARGDAGLTWAGGVAEGWALARARRARGKAEAAWGELLSADLFWIED